MVTPILEDLDPCHPQQHAHADPTLTPRQVRRAHFAEWQCLSTVIPTLPGFSQVVECQLTSGHQGRHRGEGATWTDGADFAPSDYTVGDVEDL